MQHDQPLAVLGELHLFLGQHETTDRRVMQLGGIRLAVATNVGLTLVLTLLIGPGLRSVRARSVGSFR